jgi:predicted secreted Zn-dependent protease
LRKLPRLVGLVALALALAGPAAAAPRQSTRYVYYPISGRNLAELYDSMLAGGPHVGGAKAYAATTATSHQEGRLVQGKSCHVENYVLRIDFVIRLPTLNSEKGLTASERRLWRNFAAYLRRHEEAHKAIWMGCAADLERRVRAIRATTCDEYEVKAQSLWASLHKTCEVRHQALDAEAQRSLMHQPLVEKLIWEARRSRALRAP